MDSSGLNSIGCGKGAVNATLVMQRLIIGLVPEDFHPGLDVVAGPWCFLERPQDFDTWAELPFVLDVRGSGSGAHMAFAHCAEYRDRLFPRIVVELNRLNRSAYSHEFWRQLIDYWLITLVQIFFVAEHTAAELAKTYGNRPLLVELSPLHVGWRFKDTEAFIEGALHNLDFFVWVLSRAIERQPGTHWTLSYSTQGDIVYGGGATGETSVTKATLRRLLWAVRARLAPRCFGVYGLSGWRAILLSILLSCKPPISPPLRGGPKTIPGGNEGAATLLGVPDDNFLDLALSALPDSFQNVAAIPSLGWRYVKGKMRIVGNIVVISDTVKKAIALARESGEVVLGSQHGACYGDLAVPATATVEFALDGFITWGWSRHPFWQGNFLPLVSPHLSRFRHKRLTDELIMIGVNIPLFYPRIEGTYGTKQVLQYVRAKVWFLERIDQCIFARLKYRPHLYPYMMSDVAYLKRKFPQLRLLQQRPEVSLQSCRLAVIDNPSTTLFQALAANVPTVAYWEPDYYEMHESAVQVYDGLRRAGILFNDARDAAAKVNAVWDRIDDWWGDPIVQAARQVWCDEYARSSGRWFSEWAGVLWNYRQEAKAEYVD